jgi:hypothetical protein
MTATEATGLLAVLEAAFKIVPGKEPPFLASGHGRAAGRGAARFSGCLQRAGLGHGMGILRSAL